jgi:hypothetical protein
MNILYNTLEVLINHFSQVKVPLFVVFKKQTENFIMDQRGEREGDGEAHL